MFSNDALYRELLAYKDAQSPEALASLLSAYHPLLRKLSFIDGCFSEDLYSELKIQFIKCLNAFEPHRPNTD